MLRPKSPIIGPLLSRIQWKESGKLIPPLAKKELPVPSQSKIVWVDKRLALL